MAVVVEPSADWVTSSREDPVTWPLFTPDVAAAMSVTSLEIPRYTCDLAAAVEQLSTAWCETHSRRFQGGILVVPPRHFTFPNATQRLSFIKNPVRTHDVLPGHPELDFLAEKEGVFTSVMASRFTSEKTEPAIRHLLSEPSALLLTQTPAGIPEILSSYRAAALAMDEAACDSRRSFLALCANLLVTEVIDAFVIGESAFDDPYSLDTFDRTHRNEVPPP